METLVLALGLRMMRTRINDVDAKFEQPDAKLGPPHFGASTPRHAVVDQEGVRKAVAAKRSFEMLLNRLTPLVGTGLQAQGITGMVVDHGERVAHLSITQSKASLEVHLPDVI